MLKFPKVEVRDDKGNVILTRWYLIKTKYFSMYLHHITASEPDVMHDHPWNFVSIILRGGYMEKMPNGIFARNPGNFVFHKAHDRHRILLRHRFHSDGGSGSWRTVNSWSLVLMGRKVREWGFIDRQGVWTKWSEYTKRTLTRIMP